jgi:hypothetical protein
VDNILRYKEKGASVERRLGVGPQHLPEPSTPSHARIGKKDKRSIAFHTANG